MKLLFKYLLICLAPGLLAIGAAAAVTVNFDDLAPGPEGSAVYIESYMGLQWRGWGVLDGSLHREGTTYRIGIVSPKNVAFNPTSRGGENPAAISCPGGFTLHSACLTKPDYADRMHVRVQGLVGTNVTYDNTYTLRESGPTLISFNYVGVERVLFVATPDSPVVMDDLVVTVPTPEESCTYVASPRNPTHGLGTETGVVTVNTQQDCEWSVLNTNNWITILSPARNVGGGTVNYTVSATTRARTGVIRIAGQNVTVTQTRPTKRQTLTFDDLLPGFIPSGYGGMQWGFRVLDGTIRDPGYSRAAISPDNVAFNPAGNPAFIRSISGAQFHLHSAYITYRAPVGIVLSYDVTLRVQGFVNDALAYDTSLTFTPNEPTLIHFNYFGVTEVRFIPSRHSVIFPVDNVTISTDDDDDFDDDGVPDGQDRCPDTPAGDVVNQHGCSIDQLVQCSGPARGGAWRNHAEYVGAVIKVTESFRRAGLITARERNAIIQAAMRSDCGKPLRERPRWPVRRAPQHRR
jgi:hypothetical protein